MFYYFNVKNMTVRKNFVFTHKNMPDKILDILLMTLYWGCDLAKKVTMMTKWHILSFFK